MHCQHFQKKLTDKQVALAIASSNSSRMWGGLTRSVVLAALISGVQKRSKVLKEIIQCETSVVQNCSTMFRDNPVGSFCSWAPPLYVYLTFF